MQFNFLKLSLVARSAGIGKFLGCSVLLVIPRILKAVAMTSRDLKNQEVHVWSVGRVGILSYISAVDDILIKIDSALIIRRTSRVEAPEQQ